MRGPRRATQEAAMRMDGRFDRTDLAGNSRLGFGNPFR